MAEKRIVCLQSKKVKICSLFISNNYYIYLNSYLEKIVTNDFLVYSGGQLLKKVSRETNNPSRGARLKIVYQKNLSLNRSQK